MPPGGVTRRYPGLTPLVSATLALSAGTALGLRASAPVAPVIITAACAAAVLWRLSPGKVGGALCLALYGATGAALGGIASESARSDCRETIPDGAILWARALLVAEPSLEGRASIRLSEISVAGHRTPCQGEVRARFRLGNADTVALRAGTGVVVRGHWWAMPPDGPWPRNATLAGTLTVDSVEVVDRPTGGRAWVFALRGLTQTRLRRLFDDRAPMAEALLLARREGLDPAIRDRFVQSGLVHLLAISGTHVGLVAGALLLVCRILRLPARFSACVAGAMTVAYVLLLGVPFAAARAGLQVVLVLAVRMTQRPANPFALLAAAALVLIAVDPLAVLDPGFQLSFAGTAGIIAFRRRILDATSAIGVRAARDAVATNLAASATTTPLAAYHFGRVAPVGLVANLIAVPLLGVTVPAIALALMVSFVSWPAAEFLAGAGKLMLAALDHVAGVAARVPGGNGYASRTSVLAWTSATVVTVCVAPRCLPRLRPTLRRVAAAGVGSAMLILWPVAGQTFGRGGLEIHLIDVGQGDAFGIRSPAGRWILVDAGPRSATFDAGSARIVPYLLRHGVRRLEAMILTHPDGDHIGGAAAVLDALDVGAIVDPGVAAGKPLFIELLGDARESEVRWLAASAGRVFQVDDVVLDFLAPDSVILDGSGPANDLSVVFRLTYGNFAALFMGDAPASVEQHLARRHGSTLRVQLLKVGHHGSASSTSPELLEAATPSIAMISVGRQNRYGHPARPVLERLNDAGVQVLRSDLHGNIVFHVEADGRTRARTDR